MQNPRAYSGFDDWLHERYGLTGSEFDGLEAGKEHSLKVTEHTADPSRPGYTIPKETVQKIDGGDLRTRIMRDFAGDEQEVALERLKRAREGAKARLAIMRETEDGFRIAEEDLKLRGAGELLGTRQSGLPDMRLADLAAHAELLQAAQDDARLIVDRDPELQSERGAALRALLYLFRRDDAVRTLRAG